MYIEDGREMSNLVSVTARLQIPLENAIKPFMDKFDDKNVKFEKAFRFLVDHADQYSTREYLRTQLGLLHNMDYHDIQEMETLDTQVP